MLELNMELVVSKNARTCVRSESQGVLPVKKLQKGGKRRNRGIEAGRENVALCANLDLPHARKPPRSNHLGRDAETDASQRGNLGVFLLERISICLGNPLQTFAGSILNISGGGDRERKRKRKTKT